MSELLTAASPGTTDLVPLVLQLGLALLLGRLIAVLYERTHADAASTFTNTLVLLTVLIAMVTHVIGDNVARAFSLVGALSIVRFRTVVRDTEDTAYVIFAVAIGMAIGARHGWIAATGLVVMTLAALTLRRQNAPPFALPFRILVKLTLGRDPKTLLDPTLAMFVTDCRLIQVATVRQGVALEVSYRAALRHDASAPDLVLALNRTDGVQSVSVSRVDTTDRE